jgi:hypothetical protein
MIDLIGKRFGKLKVIKQTWKDKWGKSRWLCKCDCGNKTIVLANSLKRNHTKSCGCLVTKYGPRKDGKELKEYRLWINMIQRCINPNHKYYSFYGGRGIMVCERWMEFPNFLEDMGESPPRFQIDRIDNNGDYCKENCRWVTSKINCRNRRNNNMKTYKGRTQCLTAWAEEMNINENTLRKRFDLDWTTEMALTKSIRSKRKVGMK